MLFPERYGSRWEALKHTWSGKAPWTVHLTVGSNILSGKIKHQNFLMKMIDGKVFSVGSFLPSGSFTNSNWILVPEPKANLTLVAGLGCFLLYRRKANVVQG